jgi:hypothetical protein
VLASLKERTGSLFGRSHASRVAARGDGNEDEGPITLSGATIRLPIAVEGAEDTGERLIRPALFVLFRIAVGPSADYYGPRFLAYERAGSASVGWHWPALFAPAVWAFYRKLWFTGVVFALLPLAGAHAMAWIAPWLDDYTWSWMACALLLTVVLPAISGAALANALLYRRVRKRIASAEAHASSASQAASRIGDSPPVAPAAAVLFGAIAVAATMASAVPVLLDAYDEHTVRVKVGKALAGLAPIKAQVESLSRFPRPPIAYEIPARAGAVLFDEVAVDPASGRVKLDVGASVPELAGKAILVVPAIDNRERVQWFCVPVGIPDRLLPQACRSDAR